MSANFPMTKV